MAGVLVIAGLSITGAGVVFFFYSTINKEVLSEYAQFIGGIVGSFWSLAGVALFYAALRRQGQEFEVQREQLEMQREELVLQRDELKLQRYETELQRKEFERQTEQLMMQNETLAIQKFENTFFQLLALHNDIVQSNESRDLGKEWAKTLYLRFIGRHQRVADRGSSDKETISNTDKLDFINDSYRLFPKRPEYLDRYFNNLYFLFSFINKSQIGDKLFYMNVVRSQLTLHETLLLFYFCLSDLSEKEFKLIIEEFSLLSKLPMEEIIDRSHVDFYDSQAFIVKEI